MDINLTTEIFITSVIQGIGKTIGTLLVGGFLYQFFKDESTSLSLKKKKQIKTLLEKYKELNEKQLKEKKIENDNQLDYPKINIEVNKILEENIQTDEKDQIFHDHEIINNETMKYDDFSNKIKKILDNI